MKELVHSRIKAETKNDNHDLLSNLLAANDDTLEDDMRLTDQELLCTSHFSFLPENPKTAPCLQQISSYTSLLVMK